MTLPVKRVWRVLGKKSRASSTGEDSVGEIVKILLKNRGINTKAKKKEFFEPTPPLKLSLKSLSISQGEVKKAIERIKQAKRKKEKVIVYGDYDTDGVCASAIVWETLYAMGLDVMPYIPERFSEGYGLNEETINKLKARNPKLKLIITVDNGIVANDAVDTAKSLGIDVIVTDHHEVGERYPKAFSVIHTTEVSGSGIAWIFARELKSRFKIPDSRLRYGDGLELAAIGTIADQLPLIGASRSIAKYGLASLRMTKRVGLLRLLEHAAVSPETVDTYVVNYVVAPRLNAVGRLEHAIDALRCLCTRSGTKAVELAVHLNRVNSRRQTMVEKTVEGLLVKMPEKISPEAIVVSDPKFHEGVIGLIASKLVERFFRPAIVIAEGRKVSKASCRSISGFNLIEALRVERRFFREVGGHPMAAGFSIATEKIPGFTRSFVISSRKKLSKKIITPRLKIDLEIDFGIINSSLYERLVSFEPVGVGNFRPVFLTRKVCVLDARLVGTDQKHLKMRVEKDGRVFSAIGFGLGDYFQRLKPDQKFDLVYSLTQNEWNGNTSLELRVKDIINCDEKKLS